MSIGAVIHNVSLRGTVDEFRKKHNIKLSQAKLGNNSGQNQIEQVNFLKLIRVKFFTKITHNFLIFYINFRKYFILKLIQFYF